MDLLLSTQPRSQCVVEHIGALATILRVSEFRGGGARTGAAAWDVCDSAYLALWAEGVKSRPLREGFAYRARALVGMGSPQPHVI